MARPIEDFKWVKSSFMIPTHAADIMNARQTGLSSAFGKFTDTSLGGNFAINPPPAFTRTADLKVRGDYNFNKGMGRKYSEMIDDNSQLIHMGFGVPQFNSLGSFFTGFYDTSAAYLSRTGRSPGWLYDLGRAAGFVVTLPMQPFIFAGRMYKFFANEPSSKFYYMKPTMPMYWNAVNSIANGIAVNMGIIPRFYTTPGTDATDQYPDAEDENTKFTDGQIVTDGPVYNSDVAKAYHDKMPEIFKEGGGVDVFSLASRAQRKANIAREEALKAAQQPDSMEGVYEAMREQLRKQSTMATPPSRGIRAYQEAWTKNAMGEDTSGEDTDSENGESILENAKKWGSEFMESAVAEMQDGGRFVTFRVNHTGETSESFANQTGESSTAAAMNQVSSKSRATKFSFAGGNLGDNVVADTVESIASAAQDMVSGLASGLGVSGLGALMGNAFVDIPNEWKDSTADLPKTSYTIELRSPYGNKMSRFTNLWIPFSMLLAAALPKSAGRHAYDMPFLVEIYDKGRQQIRLGIIDSFQVTRGVGNLGWTRQQEPLGLTITFSVMDLSSILHMPINASPGIFDQHTAYTDYLAVLGSASLADQFHAGSRLSLNITRKMANWDKWTSPAMYGQWVSQTMPGQIISAFAREGAFGQN